jgi:hypothetical protein
MQPRGLAILDAENCAPLSQLTLPSDGHPEGLVCAKRPYPYFQHVNYHVSSCNLRVSLERTRNSVKFGTRFQIAA